MDASVVLAIVSSVVAIAGVLVAGTGVLLARRASQALTQVGERQALGTELQADVDARAFDLERRRMFGSVPIVTFIEGFTGGDGTSGLLVGLADAVTNRGWTVDVVRVELAIGELVVEPLNPWSLAHMDEHGGLDLVPLTSRRSTLPSVEASRQLALLFPVTDIRARIGPLPGSPTIANLCQIEGAQLRMWVNEPVGYAAHEVPLRPFPYTRPESETGP